MIPRGRAGAPAVSPDIFLAFNVTVILPAKISGIFVVCPCSVVILRISPGSLSNLKFCLSGKSSVCLVDLALQGIFFFP
jgi:hypothetical protein